MSQQADRLRIGLALGSGGARGWAHFGVIQVLEEAGITPDLVCGTSIGALVGGIRASGKTAEFESWLRGLGWTEIMRLLDFSLGGGLIRGSKLIDFLAELLGETDISKFAMPFAAVATDLDSGRETWLQDGCFLEIVRASISVPGVFTPVLHNGRFLVDGGLVNPVPVSLARAMGAQLVIAVDLGSDMLGRNESPRSASKLPENASPGLMARLQAGFASLFSSQETTASPPSASAPSLLDVLASSIDIMQVRISRSRLAGEPADVLITPRLAHFAPFDFHRAAEAIAEGRRAAEGALAQLRLLPGLLPDESARTVTHTRQRG